MFVFDIFLQLFNHSTNKKLRKTCAKTKTAAKPQRLKTKINILILQIMQIIWHLYALCTPNKSFIRFLRFVNRKTETIFVLNQTEKWKRQMSEFILCMSYTVTSICIAYWWRSFGIVFGKTKNSTKWRKTEKIIHTGSPEATETSRYIYAKSNNFSFVYSIVIWIHRVHNRQCRTFLCSL